TMNKAIKLKSMILGAALGSIAALSVGAAAKRIALEAFSPLRFRVLEITRHGEPIQGKQTTVLRVAPHYGKMDSESYDFRMKHETQNLTFVSAVDAGYDIRTNDIID